MMIRSGVDITTNRLLKIISSHESKYLILKSKVDREVNAKITSVPRVKLLL